VGWVDSVDFRGENLAMKHGLGLGWEFAWSVIVAGVQGLKGCGAWTGAGLGRVVC